MLLNYPQNSNLTIMNTIYHRPVKNPVTGKLKKDYFSDDFFYRMVFFSVRKKVYMPLFIYILIHGWLAKHMNWLKYLWLKIGGKRPKVL